MHAGTYHFRSLLSLNTLYPNSSNACCRLLSLQRIARFSNVQHLSIHISKNFGEENTRVYFIGLRGEYSEVGCGFGCGGKAPHKTTQGSAAAYKSSFMNYSNWTKQGGHLP